MTNILKKQSKQGTRLRVSKAPEVLYVIQSIPSLTYVSNKFKFKFNNLREGCD